MSSSGQNSSYDLSFKILLIGDSAVGKSSLIVSFISGSVEDIAPTIGISLLVAKKNYIFVN
jgi:Ras-related protein Rab-18